MRTSSITLLLLVGSLNLLFANNTLPFDNETNHAIVNVRLDMPIIGTENINAEIFSFDVVGLESDASAHYLTSGFTKDLNNLIADLKLDKNYVKIGIKLSWGETSKYFLFDKTELTYGQIDWNKGKEPK